MNKQETLAQQIRNSELTHQPVEANLATDERVLARITDGIYRQPTSALRELISNAYDADATEVIIQTDAPRFREIAVKDNGLGLSPEVLEHLVEHIGGSPKRTTDGIRLSVTSPDDPNRSPGGRQLIGKLGIGLFSVAQLTRHFLLITKTRDDPFRTIVDITLGPVAGQESNTAEGASKHDIQRGNARIWREQSQEPSSHGTEIRLVDLLPRTRAELASEDLWTRVDFQSDDPEEIKAEAPKLHIGRMLAGQSEVLSTQPKLPWLDIDRPRDRFLKLVGAVRQLADTEAESVDLDSIFDRYLQTVWNLSLCAPLAYFDCHPFDLKSDAEFQFFRLENKPRGQASKLELAPLTTPRMTLNLGSPDGTTASKFEVLMDGVQLLRPIMFRGLPRTATAVKTPLLFIGQDQQLFEGKPTELSGGPLKFEAYLFWAPKIVPKQHQGVMIRVGNASGALFDPTFMGYQISEQTRTRQTCAEIFVHEGLEGAINIDRESFNYAHPHYQYLVKWLHSAIRQFANRHKEIGQTIRSERLQIASQQARNEVEELVQESLSSRGVRDLPEVILVDASSVRDLPKLRSEGSIALRKSAVVPESRSSKLTSTERERRKSSEAKARAIAQLLHGWGLLDRLTLDEQELLIRAILEILMVEMR